MSLSKKVELLKRKREIMAGLPHLYGFDLYPYQKEFLETKKEYQFLCAANQLGKTTTLLLKLSQLALDQELWAKLWVRKPKLFLYLLPNQKLHNENALSKWIDVLPRNKYAHDDYYGWEWENRGKDYLGINFKNGVRIRFLSYGQNVHSLQNLSAEVICFDEEPDWMIVPEVQTRTQAIQVAKENVGNAFGGFKIFGFTATKSQQYFREVFEEEGPNERFPVSDGNVYKNTVSLYDCQHHVSGKPSQWTDEKIESVIRSQPTEADVKRRVYGRFQATEGLVYQSFEMARNTEERNVQIPSNWQWYAGVDYGSGGSSHPSAIVFVAVNPDYTKAYVADAWVGTGEITTADDVILKYMDMCKGRDVVEAFYDWASKDLHTFATRRGIALTKANKDRKLGLNLLNSLFKNNMLTVITSQLHDSSFSLNLLVSQICGLVDTQNKRSNRADDDLPDALRYACSSIPFDIENANNHKELTKEIVDQHKNNRVTLRSGRKTYIQREEPSDPYEAELQEWGALFE